MTDANRNKTLSNEKMLQEIDELRRKNAELKQLEFECSRYKSLLKESEQKFFLLVHNIPDIIYLLDEHGNIKFISNTIQQYGFSPEELAGTSILDIVHPEDREKAVYRINERRRGARSTKLMEVRFIAKNTDVIHMEMKSREVGNFPVFSVSAEGQYVSSNGDVDHKQFIGTLGVAREVGHRDSRAEQSGGESRLVPICSTCKNIRTENGPWITVEEYCKQHANIHFTHSICPDCVGKLHKKK